ncbi:hypothetical protein [Ilumatobacter sp.]|uniref:hypothetical protein n=1 Tax=Ilumatobacter sp. TaxID=1967498 RepID=UPI003753891A
MPDVILPALNEAGEHDALAVSEQQKGFGAACWAGRQASTSNIVCFMDCDASLDPLALPLVTGYAEHGACPWHDRPTFGLAS